MIKMIQCDENYNANGVYSKAAHLKNNSGNKEIQSIISFDDSFKVVAGGGRIKI